MLQDLAPPVELTTRQQEALGKLIARKKATAKGPPQRTKREIQRRLQYLFHAGFLQRHKLSDGEPIAYALGNLGAEELALHYGFDRQEIDWTTKNRESHERYIRHALMVTRFRHALVLALRNSGEASLEEWTPGGGFQAEVTYLDAVRTREGIRTQEVTRVVKPDGFFVVESEGKSIHYFLEADRSTMSNNRYLSKLKSYYAFYATYVKTKKITRMNRMRVLTLTVSEERKTSLRKTAQAVSDDAKGLFWFICQKSYLDNPLQLFEHTWQTLEDDTFRSIYPHD